MPDSIPFEYSQGMKWLRTSMALWKGCRFINGKLKFWGGVALY